jgi:selenide,water dikinase
MIQITMASHRNWTSYGSDVRVARDMPEWERHLLTDPQTSGGLLVACAPERAAAVADAIEAAGYPAARIIGHAEAGAAAVRIEAAH